LSKTNQQAITNLSFGWQQNNYYFLDFNSWESMALKKKNFLLALLRPGFCLLALKKIFAKNDNIYF